MQWLHPIQLGWTYEEDCFSIGFSTLSHRIELQRKNSEDVKALEAEAKRTSKFEWALKKIRKEKIISAPTWATNLFFESSALLDVDIVPSCDLVQYQGKLMMQPWENGKSPNLGPPIFFSWVLPLLVVRQCSELSSYAISRKTNEPNLKKWHQT